MGVEVSLGKGKPTVGPRTLSSYPHVNFWAKSRIEPNSPSDLLER